MSRVVPVAVRRSPSHCCIVMATRTDEGAFIPVRVIADAGNVPYLRDLINLEQEFKDVRALRRAVKNRMRIGEAELFSKHVVVSEDTLLSIRNVLQASYDAPLEAELCAQFVDDELYVYLLGHTPAEGIVVNDFVLGMPQYTETGYPEVGAPKTAISFYGDLTK